MYEENEIYSKYSFTVNGVKSSKQSFSQKNGTTRADNVKDIELPPLNVANNVERENVSSTNEKYAIEIKNATAKWSENSSEDSLNSVSIKVGTRSLVAIIGPVGAGKVSLRRYEWRQRHIDAIA